MRDLVAWVRVSATEWVQCSMEDFSNILISSVAVYQLLTFFPSPLFTDGVLSSHILCCSFHSRALLTDSTTLYIRDGFGCWDAGGSEQQRRSKQHPGRISRTHCCHPLYRACYEDPRHAQALDAGRVEVEEMEQTALANPHITQDRRRVYGRRGGL